MKKIILTFVAACCLSAVVPQSAFALIDPINPGKVIDWEEGHFTQCKFLGTLEINGVIFNVYMATLRDGTTKLYHVDKDKDTTRH